MYSAALSRKDFLDWVGGGQLPAVRRSITTQNLRSPKSGEVLLLWRDQPDQQADVDKPIICVPEREITDFYAFVGTYIATHVPFSAYYRVVPFDRLRAALSSGRIATKVPPSMVGIAVAEAFVNWPGERSELSLMSVSNVCETLSSAFLSAIFHGYRSETLVDLPFLWERAQLTNRRERSTLSPSAISIFWSYVAGSINVDGSHSLPDETATRAIIRGTQELIAFGDLQQETLRSLTMQFSGLELLAQSLKATREERIRSIGPIIATLLQGSGDPIAKEFLAGYFAAQVGNGSFSFLRFAAESTKSMPGAILWFALASSTQKSSDVLTMANCIGRRAAREIFRSADLLGEPNADISVEEFDILSGAKGSKFRTAAPSMARIELVPGVGIDVPAPRQSPEAAELRTRERYDELRELRYLIDRTRVIADRLARETHPELFPDQPRQKTRR